MKIKVKLYTILKKYDKGKIDENNTLAIKKGKTVGDLISYLGLPENSVSLSIVNGIAKQKEYKLQEGDEVKFFSYVGGG